MRRLAPLALILMAGCADADPRTSRLQPGQQAKTYVSESFPHARITPIVGEHFPQGSPAWEWNNLSNGDVVNVLADANKPDDGSRLVQVEVARVVDNKVHDLTGTKCLVERQHLRPTR